MWKPCSLRSKRWYLFCLGISWIFFHNFCVIIFIPPWIMEAYTLLTKKKIYIWLNIILCTIFFFCLLSTFLNIANLLCNMAAFTVDKNSIMKGLSRLEPFLKIFQFHNLRPFSMLLSYHLANYISKINETTAFF